MNTREAATVDPVRRVVATLTGEGYEQVNTPMRVGGIAFEFAAMLAGRASLDLVVVVDTALVVDDDPLRAQVQGLARALDLVRSRRSLTVVFVGPHPSAALVQTLSGVARVLRTGSPGPEDAAALRRAIAVLLPLEIPGGDEDAAQSWGAFRERIVAGLPPEIESLVERSGSGSESVEAALRDFLAEPLDGVLEVLDEDHRTASEGGET